MNRSLLLVICDFLLLSLLALARFDDPEDQAEPEAARAIEQDAAANQDLIDVLKMSLDAEQETREEISSELAETREELEARAKALAEREAKLEETQQTAAQLAEEKSRLEMQREELSRANQEAERERQRLAQQSEEARRKLEEAERDRVELAKSLAEVKETAVSSTERLSALQQELAQKAETVDQLQEERERLASAVQTTELEKRALATQLEVSQAEAKIVAQSLELARRDIEVTREEKKSLQQTTDKLAEGVGSLAQSTDQIREEVKRAQPLSPNTIFDRYQKNKIQITFDSTESALLGTSREQRSFDTVLVREGEGAVYALMPVARTPFDESGVQAVSGVVRIGSRAYRFSSVGALMADPRILTLALPEQALEGTEINAFSLATEPLKFPEAVLINGQRRFYGEVGFKIEPAHPEYLEMDSSIFNDLFGEFSPRNGDLVFSRTGELIGMMVNDRYAVITPSTAVSYRIGLGDGFSTQQIDDYQSRVIANERALPPSIR